MNEFSLSRKLLSAYFMSILIFTSIFTVFQSFIVFLTSLISNIIFSVLGVSIAGSDNTWWALFFVSFAVVFAIKQFIVLPLGFYVSEDSSIKWESYFLVFLVIGCLMYNINRLFPDYPMPAIIPNFLVKFLDGYRPGMQLTSSDNIISSVVAPITWNAGPIILMWIMHVRSRITPFSS
jgi:hypothetical protein